ncbi:MAG: MoaD/ThiS family protein [Candidatus Thorarchaeota archaeon]|nr:MAG: MoaD/ThiS family protein [Candidatus Thorarchaeota archaeon]RLI62425.1 MAG: MoaD/ThiS family protein [Candidatus Thorarchaeota archaeon]
MTARVRIRVKLYATLKRFAPPGVGLGEAFTLELEEGTIGEAIRRLGIPDDDVSIVMVNGVQVRDRNHVLNGGDLLVMFPPIGGGAGAY